MHILLTNDDGIFAPGLGAIYERLKVLGDVSVVAPSEVKSGASHGVTLGPLGCEKVDVEGRFVGFSVDGTPADCVKLGVMNLLDKPVDLVVSGINHGANVGVHVHYSGTVAAAKEGAFFGIPAIALSAAFEEHINIEAAADHCLAVIRKLLPLSGGDVINVNIPRLCEGEPKGVRVVGHSTRGYDESYIAGEIDKGRQVYYYMWGDHRDEGAVLDTTAILDGYITVTALHFDMTDVERNERLRKIEW
ncbi:MAG: 5'/3'-nucleotidase SurE [Anaerohalosphaera sp.]|nr:5'/3'-nucleotidase SurE [Anaerohalosphaera sp.]